MTNYYQYDLEEYKQIAQTINKHLKAITWGKKSLKELKIGAEKFFPAQIQSIKEYIADSIQAIENIRKEYEKTGRENIFKRNRQKRAWELTWEVIRNAILIVFGLQGAETIISFLTKKLQPHIKELKKKTIHTKLTTSPIYTKYNLLNDVYKHEMPNYYGQIAGAEFVDVDVNDRTYNDSEMYLHINNKLGIIWFLKAYYEEKGNESNTTTLLDALYNELTYFKNALDKKNVFIFAEEPLDKEERIKSNTDIATKKLNSYNYLLKACANNTWEAGYRYDQFKDLDPSKAKFNAYDLLALNPYTQSFIIENDKPTVLTAEEWEQRLTKIKNLE